MKGSNPTAWLAQSADYKGILEILYCNPKGRRALLRVPSTVGRSVRLCWALSKPKGPNCWRPGAGLEANQCFSTPTWRQIKVSVNPYRDGRNFSSPMMNESGTSRSNKYFVLQIVSTFAKSENEEMPARPLQGGPSYR